MDGHNFLYRCCCLSMQEVLSFSLEWLMDLAHSDFSGHSNTTSRGLCEVVWTVEADLAAGQLLYVTGDPISLGGWQPDMAIQMCATEQAKLWKTEVKVIFTAVIIVKSESIYMIIQKHQIKFWVHLFKNLNSLINIHILRFLKKKVHKLRLLSI